MQIMPRNKIQRSTYLSRICIELNAYLISHNMSQSQLSRESNVPQYQISRLLSGRTKTITGHVQTLCNYANLNQTNGIADPCDNSRLQHALGRVWDGSEESANLVAMVIESMEPLIKHLHSLPISQSRRQ